MVLAVGVLAVLAVLAVSYVTVVRVDRRGAAAYQVQENLQLQVDVATEHIRSVLTADLFGNRAVTTATPRFEMGTDLPNWPRAFEDGGYWDYPWTETDPGAVGFTFNDAMPGQNPPFYALLRPSLGERAFADNAWLASFDPVHTGVAPFPEWDTWPQITNLRGVYRYSQQLTAQGQATWVRGDGRFADLAQLLLQEPPGFSGGTRFGYACADLRLDNTGNVWTDPITGQQNGPQLGVNQQVFDLQMNELQEFYETGSPPMPGIVDLDVRPADERFWADTDGDGRADARWQQLDSLGNAFGKVWVIAARIVDNSAMANVNSHYAFMDYNNPGDIDIIGDGRSPADIDLYKLIASQVHDAMAINPVTGAAEVSAHPDIDLGPTNNRFDINRLESSWREHLNNGLRTPRVLEQLDQLDGATGDLALGDPGSFINEWNAGALYPLGDPNTVDPLSLKRGERAAMWRYFGARPLRPVATAGGAYPLRDEIDLRAFSGFNYLGLVSGVERRLDASPTDDPADAGFLPGQAPAYDAAQGPALGPLRSKEWDNRRDSPRTFDDEFVLDPDYTNQDKLERLRKDIRRLLTTVSGEGDIGPVPVLNPHENFQNQFSTRKVHLSRFATPPGGSPDPNRIRQPLQDAFSALVWALAPLATNQPLMAPLDQIDELTYAQLSENSDLHYGGGPSGPARALELTLGLSQGDAGSAYAVLRAASMAVNLADAIDAETMAGTATVEQPTIVRLFNQFDTDTLLANNATLQSSVTDTGAIPLGIRFPQGDIWADNLNPPIGEIASGQNTGALPVELVGEPDHGVTLVGLDRQPFLVRALSVAVYADQGSYVGTETIADSVIETDSPAEQLGSLFVIELGNPWPDQIDLAGLSIRIANDAGDVFEIDFDGSTIANGPFINPGLRTAFYHFQDPNGPPAAAQAEWDTLRDQLESVIVGNGGADEIREIETLAPAPPDGVMFQHVGGDNLPVQLVRQIITSSGPVEILIDRLSTDEAGAEFPATLSGAIDLAEFNTSPVDPMQIPTFTGRVAVQSSLRRPNEIPAGGGFPSYVVERPGDNFYEIQALEDTIQVWKVSQPDPEPRIPVDDLGDELLGLGEIPLVGLLDGAHNLAPFTLFVPNGPLLGVGELLQICAFAHMYVHSDQSPPNIADAVDPAATGPGSWRTVSEQLGEDAHFFYNTQTSSVPNPYLGILDPSRFILGSDASTIGTPPELPDLGPILASPGLLPDALAVPLATRVVDAFEAIPVIDNLVRGRVNINTAPMRILELLPLVDPRDPQDPFSLLAIGSSGWTYTAQNGERRVDWIDRYRRRDPTIPAPGSVPSHVVNPGVNPDPSAPQRFTLFPGLRLTNDAQSPWSPGFVTRGELAILDEWSGSFEGSPASNVLGFLELGADNAPQDQNVLPFEFSRPNAPAIHQDFYAVDGPRERLALFRAISNLVSTRSDVFTVWYVLRAYDPNDIESIAIPPGLNEDEIVDLMNPGSQFAVNPEEHTGLTPVFERRVLLILDRSNVRRPTDRPRILLQVELPPN